MPYELAITTTTHACNKRCCYLWCIKSSGTRYTPWVPAAATPMYVFRSASDGGFLGFEATTLMLHYTFGDRNVSSGDAAARLPRAQWHERLLLLLQPAALARRCPASSRC